jgi:hypothetical protein
MMFFSEFILEAVYFLTTEVDFIHAVEESVDVGVQ